MIRKIIQKHRKKEKKTTFTKEWVNRVMWFSCIWGDMELCPCYYG